jgi:hypothetical protein
MNHFGWAPDFIYKMSWANFNLFLDSIPRYDSKPKEEPIEVKDSDEIF